MRKEEWKHREKRGKDQIRGRQEDKYEIRKKVIRVREATPAAEQMRRTHTRTNEVAVFVSHAVIITSDSPQIIADMRPLGPNQLIY